MKPDDCTISDQQRQKIRLHAKKSLEQAGAVGRFPTPVSDVMAAAKVVVSEENALDEGFLVRMRKKAVCRNLLTVQTRNSKRPNVIKKPRLL